MDVKTSLEAVVDIASQTLTVLRDGVVIARYPVSTAANGVGCEENSGKTPLGLHRVCEFIGEGMQPGQIFSSRIPVEGCVLARDRWADGEGDAILTRIMWLEGLEDCNRGAGHDSRARYIYIHGTNHEAKIGTPCSHGCIRMRNDDIIELFDLAKSGMSVQVKEVLRTCDFPTPA